MVFAESWQPSLLNIRPEEVVFNVYHDESGTYKKDRWFIVGLLFVPERREGEVLTALRRERKAEGYWRELHFHKLEGGWGGEGGAKACLARRWLKLYVNGLVDSCPFYALAVDTRSPAFDHKRFPRKFHAYNRFTRMALISAIAWEFHNHEHIALRVYSDNKSRRPGKEELVGKPGIDWDNFESYLPVSVVEDLGRRKQGRPHKYPDIRVLGNVITVNSDALRERPELRAKSELIQLTDVILGAVAQAITARSGKVVKRTLGKIAAEWILDVRKPPWKQQLRLYRRFCVAYFPNLYGRAYKEGEIRIIGEGDQIQPTLF